MNDDPNLDPELRRRLEGARDELTGHQPRPDGRIQGLLGEAPPAAPHARPPYGDDPTAGTPVVTPLADRPRRSRVAVAVGAAAAAVLLVGGGILAAQAGSSSRLDTDTGTGTASSPANDADPSALSGQPEPDTDDPGEPETTEPNEPDSDEPGDTHGGEHPEGYDEYFRCLIDQIHAMVESGERPGDPLEACGEPPPFDLGNLGSLDWCPDTGTTDEPDTTDEPGTTDEPDTTDEPGMWCRSPFDWLDGFEPGDWNLDEIDPDLFGLGPLDLDGLDLGGICEHAETDDGSTLRCAWPPCTDGAEADCAPHEVCPHDGASTDPDGSDAGPCFGFRFDFGFGFEGDGLSFPSPWGSGGWPEWVPSDQQEPTTGEA